MTAEVFQCPYCSTRTRHPQDVASQYCPVCHWWTGVTEMYLPWLAEREPLDVVRHAALSIYLREPMPVGFAGSPADMEIREHLAAAASAEDAVVIIMMSRPVA